MLFNHLKHNEVVWIGTQVSMFLKAVFDVSPGIKEGLLDLHFLHKLPGKENITTSVDFTGSNDIICLQEIHGKDEFLQALQFLDPCLQLFGTFIPNNTNARVSSICIQKDLLLDDAIVTHVGTCQGRDIS